MQRQFGSCRNHTCFSNQKKAIYSLALLYYHYLDGIPFFYSACASRLCQDPNSKNGEDKKSCNDNLGVAGTIRAFPTKRKQFTPWRFFIITIWMGSLSFILLVVAALMGWLVSDDTVAVSALVVPSPVRRCLFTSAPIVVVTVATTCSPLISQAFEGSGASAFSGRNLLSTATKVKGYRDRIVADVKDFNALGAAIQVGETSGPAWVSVFIQYQRREPDPVGRTYAAQVDLLGADKSGGAALLLVNTAFAKPNKPPDNLPQYKKYLTLSKTFDAIEKAGKAGDALQAKKAWLKAAKALSEYLASVEMPADLSDALYAT